ncbi:MAG: ankyrin repeat domain-containing protein [Gammaproteobacteria bacterium]|nr:ankyrin repeat domain-containing protein [Gammaproteobacteria bacterium]MCW5583321.1 ankyrin repeat domain-containing protein [Gammaproteobacteria bacterium]
MQTRQHYLEKALESSIKLNDLQAATGLIKTILKSNGASLESLDKEGRSFLFLALEMGASQIARLLLNIQEDNDNILFSKDKNKQSLLHIAASKGYYSIVIRLVEIAERKKKLNLYLEEDDQGHTVLHQAAASGEEKVIELLLKKTNEFDRLFLAKFINQVNKDGNTALHYAFKNVFKVAKCKSIEHLIQYGAHLNLSNNKHDAAIILFSNLTQEEQVEIFLSLNKQNQDRVLQSYKQLLIKINMPENLKNCYFKLTSLHSLQALLIAHHELNPNVPIPIYEKKDPNENDVIIDIEKYLSDTALQQMPLYRGRIALAKEETEKNPGKKKGKNVLTEKEKSDEADNRSNDEILNTDRITLTSLIDDIASYLNDLQHRPTASISSRVLTVLIPTVFLLSLAGLEYVLVSEYLNFDNKFHTDVNSPDWDRNWNLRASYLAGSTFSGIIGCLAVVGYLFCCAQALWRKEPTVSHGEWASLINQLDKDLIEKLQYLEEKEKIDNEKYLPTQIQNIRDLEEQVKTLGECRPLTDMGIGIKVPYTSQPISTVIHVFRRLKNIVERIQQDMNLSKKPLSLFFKPSPSVVVDISSDSEYNSDDELLPKHTKRSAAALI